MTLYEEVFANFYETAKFYRFEGYNSSINYSFNQDDYLQIICAIFIFRLH
ncbi:MAG: hypothetical protein IJA94_02225 [Bacilli bacterium]|nr:hypothetical protein [Bacilli bacterium]